LAAYIYWMHPFFHLSVQDPTPRAAELGVGNAVLGTGR
jgi:hypothetical protein